eukprot:502553-Ditylum_brightwellii.AAC.1
MLPGCPVIWSSKLQTLISESTMEAEYIALSMSCQELLPLKDLTEEVASFLHLAKEKKTIHTTIWDDNESALKLATLEPPRMTPRSKHIEVKYHWCRALIPDVFSVKSILTADQLYAPSFKKLRMSIMGW